MHRHIVHNKCYSTFEDFSIAMLNFLRDGLPSAPILTGDSHGLWAYAHLGR